MKMVLAFVMMLLVSPLANADPDTKGIPFRVSALEELTLLQQEAIESLMSGGGKTSWVLKDANEVDIGNVIGFTTANGWLTVETDIGGRSVLLWVQSNRVWRTARLVFSEPGCSGDPHAMISEDSWYKEVLVAADENPNGSAVPYEQIGDPIDGPWASTVLYSGACDTPPPEDPIMGTATPVVPIAGNLYETYPRAPEPGWHLAEK